MAEMMTMVFAEHCENTNDTHTCNFLFHEFIFSFFSGCIRFYFQLKINNSLELPKKSTVFSINVIGQSPMVEQF